QRGDDVLDDVGIECPRFGEAVDHFTDDGVAAGGLQVGEDCVGYDKISKLHLLVTSHDGCRGGQSSPPSATGPASRPSRCPGLMVGALGGPSFCSPAGD